MGAVWTMAIKDLRLLGRDRFGLFFVMFFPLLYGLFFGVLFMGEGDEQSRGAMPVAAVDQDGTAESRAYLDRLGESAAVELRPMDLAEARTAVRKGQVVAFVLLEEGFGAGNFFRGGTARPKLGIDPSRRAEAGYLQGLATAALFRGVFGDPDAMHAQFRRSIAELDAAEDMPAGRRALLKAFLTAGQSFFADLPAGAGEGGFQVPEPELVPVARDERTGRPRSSFEVSFPSAILWGLLGCAAGFAITLVRERSQGTLLRLRVAPISRAQILAGKGLACFLACVMVIAVMLAFGSLVLGIRISNPLGLLIATACTSLCFVGIMMLVSVLGRTEQAVGGAGWAVFVVMAMIGGGMVPLIAMPRWLLTVSDLSPVKWGIYALEGAIWRDFSLAEMAAPCAILLAIGAAFFVLGVLRLRRLEAA